MCTIKTLMTQGYRTILGDADVFVVEASYLAHAGSYGGGGLSGPPACISVTHRTFASHPRSTPEHNTAHTTPGAVFCDYVNCSL